jgi:predicted cupin superfamily sugar epimerase
MTAEDVKKLLGLKPHPQEGGWYVRTYEASEFVSASAFCDARYGGARRTGTAIYYLLEADTFSEMHRLQSDEVSFLCGGRRGDAAVAGGWTRHDGSDRE